MNATTLTCVGFMMDGNRRFAKASGMDTLFGHTAGKEKFFEVVTWVHEAHIKHAVFYAFSTENWRREQTEVAGLMTIFLNAVKELQQKNDGRSISIKIIGRKKDLSPEMQEAVLLIEKETAFENPDTTIWIALSYGGRAEIVDAVNKAIEGNKPVTEESFRELMWSAGMPDPDVIIRTAGDQRLSNFLTWQTVYSELFFTDTYWPAFTKEEFTRILSDYEKRERRIGK